jgi:hypothetical protein
LKVFPLRFVTVILPADPGPLPKVALYPTTSQLEGRPERFADGLDVEPYVPDEAPGEPYVPEAAEPEVDP